MTRSAPARPPLRAAAPVCVLIGALAFAAPAAAQSAGPLAEAERPRAEEGGTAVFEFENDFFSNTDRHFTHGTKLTYITAERAPGDDDLISQAAAYVPFFPDRARARATYALGQNMYTPEDIKLEQLIRDDRPYAGWLYVGFGLVAEDPERKRIDNLEIDLGVVGPWSQADRTQQHWHRWFGFDDPKGWDNQLENEPGVMILFERQQRFAKMKTPFGVEAELLPSFGFALGNVMTYGSLGATVRIGGDLDVDYGPPRIRPSLPTGGFLRRSDGFNWYLFAAVGGRAVARNIFLDGNSFSDSHSVDKKLLVGDLQAGAALQYDGWRLAYTHILRTREFDGQDTPDRFGSLSLSYQF